MYLSLNLTLNDICRSFLASYDDNYFIPIKKGGLKDKFFALTAQDPLLLQVHEWGYPGLKGKTFEIVPEKGIVKHPVFLHAIRKYRCIIPVTSFGFEVKGQVYDFTLYGKNIFSLAGLYTGEKFCLITVPANRLVSRVNDYMPVILTKGGEQTWLKGTSVLSNITSLLYPFDHSVMRVNNYHPYMNYQSEKSAVRSKKEGNNDKKTLGERIG